MFNFLQSLFKKNEYSLGAFQNPEDIRDIHISAVQLPKQIPTTYKSDISMLQVENQMAHGTCVGQAISKLVEFYIERKGQTIPQKLSARSLYIRSKAQDGIPNLQGTIPRVAANVLVKEGIATDQVVPDDNTLSYEGYMSYDMTDFVKSRMWDNRLSGYVAVTPTFEDVKQAIYQNGVVTGSLPVDTNWFYGIIKRVGDIIGYHYTLWYGYDEKGIFFRNSWGDMWGNKGDSYFLWADYQDKARDIIAFADIPKEILENVKKVKYQFTKGMGIGDKSNDVLELQKRLESEGLWPITTPKTGYYGILTCNAVYRYQKLNKIASDEELDKLMGRVCGNKTLTFLNGKVNKIDLWCEGIKKVEGYFDGSRSFRNKNIGNLKYIGQKTAIGQDDKGFCIFPDYEAGYNALKSMLISACLGNSKVYNPNMDLYDFYSKYAPDSDGNNSKHYAESVAKTMNVSPNDKIKTFI